MFAIEEKEDADNLGRGIFVCCYTRLFCILKTSMASEVGVMRLGSYSTSFLLNLKENN